MGAKLKTSKSTSTRRRQRRDISDINVTPFVDVMLVLLIVLMVTAPLMTVGVPVDLPKTNSKALNENTEPLTVSVTAEARIFLQETEVDIDSLVPKLVAITHENPDTRIFIRGDQKLNYGVIMEVMG